MPEHSEGQAETIKKFSTEIVEMFSLAVTADDTCPTCQAKVVIESLIIMSILNGLIETDEMVDFLIKAVELADGTEDGEVPEGYQRWAGPNRGRMN